MIIMGGGYDNCEDNDNGTVNNSCTSSAKGNEIYVLDADTGALLTTLNTDRGVIGSVTVLPDSNGLAQYAYAADLGGNVYRITIGTAAPASWTITKIASLGCDTVTTCSANRKFMFGPDVVVDASGVTYLLLGSGDREKPLSAYTATTSVQNEFFAIVDNPASATWLSSESGNCGSSVICMASLTPITSTATPTSVSPKGWSLKLRSTEQVVTSAITIYGTVTFSTQMPAVADSTTCGSNLGTASVYNINYLNAAASGADTRSQTIQGGGLPPSPVAGFVTLDDGTTVSFKIGSSPISSLGASSGGSGGSVATGPQYKSRVYWYIQQ
jgi:type IV pilus assembly protein PilY1